MDGVGSTLDPRNHSSSDYDELKCAETISAEETTRRFHIIINRPLLIQALKPRIMITLRRVVTRSVCRRKRHNHGADTILGAICRHRFWVSRSCSDISREESSAEEISQAREAYRGRIDIRENGERGWGLVALRDFKKGERVMGASWLTTTDEPGSHTIQTNWNQHVYVDLPARYINHFCNHANVGMTLRKAQDEREQGFDFYALRRIQTNEELLWDYETTEFELSSPFACSCGSPDCRGVLSGFRYNGHLVLQAYEEKYIAPYLITYSESSR